MSYAKLRFFAIFTLFTLLMAPVAFGQKDTKKTDKGKVKKTDGTPVLWRPVNIAERDLFLGPGGEEMKPDLSSITFIEDDKNGHNKKFRIKDGSGREWVAKIGKEARPETVAVRLLWGLGYVTEINYLVPTLTIPGKGTFTDVRLEARPKGTTRLDQWKWRDNPFVGTNELQGLKIMMVFLTNWDLLDMQNKIVRVKGENGPELQYIISDLGASFGKLGNNNIPMFYRLGRKTDDPKAWSKSDFVKGAKGDQLQLASTGQKSFGLMKDVTLANGRWLANLLTQLSDKQLEDAFRAANYSPAELDTLSKATRRRINELVSATEAGSVTGNNK